MKSQNLPFNEIQKISNCFDLLIFYHPSLISQTIIKTQKMRTHMDTCGHVGLLLKDIKIDNIDMSRPKIWESTIHSINSPKNMENAKNNGVQIRDFEEVVKAYQQTGGRVGLCKLKVVPKYTGNFQDIYDKYKNYKYTTLYNLIAAAFPIFRTGRTMNEQIFSHKEKVFCSEFVARVYIDIGVITDETDGKLDGKILNPMDVIPTDFINNDEDGMIPFVEAPIWIDKL